jgi:hypothetical protein
MLFMLGNNRKNRLNKCKKMLSYKEIVMGAVLENHKISIIIMLLLLRVLEMVKTNILKIILLIKVKTFKHLCTLLVDIDHRQH